MSLTLITGPANAGKAGAVLTEYRAQLAREPLLVVPTLADVSHYQRELAATSVFGAQVLRFRWLFAEVARRAGYRAQVIGSLQRERLVAAAVASCKLAALAASARSPGFVGAASRLIAELERTLVTPQRLNEALRTWAGADDGRRRYGDEVASVYSAYSRELERCEADDQDLFAWRALDALRNAPDRWGSTPVYFYGFDDFTGAERDAIETLAGACGAQVTVALAYEAGREALAGRATAFEELRPLATTTKALPARDAHYAPASRIALHHLERELFEQQSEPVAPGDAVRVLEAGGNRMEVELVAAQVLALLRSGFAPEQIAVVLRSPPAYVPLLKQVFSAYGVPIAADVATPVEHTSLGRALLGLLRAALLDGDVSDLLAYLRAPGKFERPHVLDRFETALRRRAEHGADGARELWEEEHSQLTELDRLADAERRGPRALLEEVGRRAAALFAAPHRRRANVLEPGELVDAAALARVGAALTELDALPDRALPNARELIATLSALEVRSARPTTGAVVVADPLAVRARRFRAVFVCALQEHEFPLPAAPEPFLPDELRRELAVASGLRLRRREDPLADERYLFYAVVSRAQEVLALSYRTSDEEGNRLVPSFFLDDVRALYGAALAAPTVRRAIGDVVWDRADAPTIAELERAQASREVRVAPASISPLSTPAALAELESPEALSAGSLECYAECPVKWLVERKLRPESLEPDPEPLARGSFAHKLLERTFVELRAQTGSARVTSESLPAALELLARAAGDEAPNYVLAARPAQARAQAHAVEAELRRFLTHEAQALGTFEPTHFELDFGFAEAELPGLELGGGAALIRGRIDRIDVDPESGEAIVRDYKSGRARPEYRSERWAQARRLQVALYMLAVRRLLAGHEPVGGLYQPLRASDLRGRGLLLECDSVRPLAESVAHPKDLVSRERFEEALEQAEHRALELASRLRSGRLEPDPDTCAYNGGCKYPGICRGAGT